VLEHDTETPAVADKAEEFIFAVVFQVAFAVVFQVA